MYTNRSIYIIAFSASKKHISVSPESARIIKFVIEIRNRDMVIVKCSLELNEMKKLAMNY